MAIRTGPTSERGVPGVSTSSYAVRPATGRAVGASPWWSGRSPRGPGRPPPAGSSGRSAPGRRCPWRPRPAAVRWVAVLSRARPDPHVAAVADHVGLAELAEQREPGLVAARRTRPAGCGCRTAATMSSELLLAADAGQRGQAEVGGLHDGAGQPVERAPLQVDQQLRGGRGGSVRRGGRGEVRRRPAGTASGDRRDGGTSQRSAGRRVNVLMVSSCARGRCETAENLCVGRLSGACHAGARAAAGGRGRGAAGRRPAARAWWPRASPSTSPRTAPTGLEAGPRRGATTRWCST